MFPRRRRFSSCFWHGPAGPRLLRPLPRLAHLRAGGARRWRAPHRMPGLPVKLVRANRSVSPTPRRRAAGGYLEHRPTPLSPLAGVANWHTQLNGVIDRCGNVVQIYGICSATFVPAVVSGDMECGLFQNGHLVWESPGGFENFGGLPSYAIETPAFTVGPRGTYWAIGMASSVEFPGTGGPVETPFYPAFQVWSDYTVH